MIRHSKLGARPLRAFAAAAALVVVSLLATAPGASADLNPGAPHCNHDLGRSFNACLHVQSAPVGFSYIDAHVGIDVYMPAQYAREIVACGADFKATLMGDDGGGSKDDVIRRMNVVNGWPVAGADGLGAELIGPSLHYTELDEDDGSAEDEIYAKVTFFDCHIGQPREFRTGTMKGDWS